MNFIINFEKYERILDIMLDSKFEVSEKRNNNTKKFKCYVACKQGFSRKMIDIFEIQDDLNKRDNLRSILYQQNGKKLMAKISDDADKVVFTNGVEHYILKGKS